MSVEGPQFPPYIPSNYPSGAPSQFQTAAQGSIFSMLAALSPVSQVGQSSAGMTIAQQNTFWLMRVYAELMTEYLVNDENLAEDGFQFRLCASLTNQIPSDIANMAKEVDISFPQQVFQEFNSGNTSAAIKYLNGIIAGTDPSSSVFDFKTLCPDDTFNYLITQLGLGVYNQENSLPQNSFFTIFSSTSTWGPFLASYFYQKNLDSNGNLDNTALQGDLNQIVPFLQAFQDYWNPNHREEDPNNPGNQQLYNMVSQMVSDVQTLQTSGSWTFKYPPVPQGNNLTPVPWWDTSNTPPAWSYDNNPYLYTIDQDLAENLPYIK
jgi:hypothetical protein